MKTFIRASTIALAFLLCGVQWYCTMPAAPHIEVSAPTTTSIQSELWHGQHLKQIAVAEQAAIVVFQKYHCSDQVTQLTAQYAVQYKIAVKLVAAVLVTESSCHQYVVSSTGDVGLMQVNHRVWHYTTNQLFDADLNIHVGTKILSAYIHEYGMYLGLRHYRGITPGSAVSYEYADRVFKTAGLRLAANG